MHINDKATACGYFEIIALEGGKEVYRSPKQNNLILNALWSLIIQQHAGTLATPVEVSTLEIGTGDEPVMAGDTDLEAMAVDGIPPAKISPSTKSIIFEFFITDNDLPDGTYTELGLRSGATLITRALFTTPYNKVSGRDTIIRYTLSYDSE